MIYEGKCVDCKEKLPTLTWNISHVLDSGEIVPTDVAFTAVQGKPLKVNLSNFVTVLTIHTSLTIKLI